MHRSPDGGRVHYHAIMTNEKHVVCMKSEWVIANHSLAIARCKRRCGPASTWRTPCLVGLKLVMLSPNGILPAVLTLMLARRRRTPHFPIYVPPGRGSKSEGFSETEHEASMAARDSRDANWHVYRITPDGGSGQGGSCSCSLSMMSLSFPWISGNARV